jgi:Putative FMN-binding domain
MYVPTAFAESDLTKLYDFIEQNSFGLLVTHVDGLPFASHLSFLLERKTGPKGTLVGHRTAPCFLKRSRGCAGGGLAKQCGRNRVCNFFYFLGPVLGTDFDFLYGQLNLRVLGSCGNFLRQWKRPRNRPADFTSNCPQIASRLPVDAGD